jgi:hypothetical protein
MSPRLGTLRLVDLSALATDTGEFHGETISVDAGELKLPVRYRMVLNAVGKPP